MLINKVNSHSINRHNRKKLCLRPHALRRLKTRLAERGPEMRILLFNPEASAFLICREQGRSSDLSRHPPANLPAACMAAAVVLHALRRGLGQNDALLPTDDRPGLTAAGTVADSHGIPYYLRPFRQEEQQTLLGHKGNKNSPPPQNKIFRPGIGL